MFSFKKKSKFILIRVVIVTCCFFRVLIFYGYCLSIRKVLFVKKRTYQLVVLSTKLKFLALFLVFHLLLSLFKIRELQVFFLERELSFLYKYL